MRIHNPRNDAGLAAVQIALMVAIAALVGIIIFAIITLVGGGSDDDPTPSVSPTTSAVASTPIATATDTAGPGLPATWAEVAAEDLPSTYALRAGEPNARSWDDSLWRYVDGDWDVEIWGDPAPDAEPYTDDDQYLYQALYLVSPDGMRFKAYNLRTDIGLYVEATAMDELVVWIGRVYWEATQTVEFNLTAGTASETWATAGFSNVTAADNEDGWFVYHVDTLADGRMVWEGSGFGEPLNGVFFRAPGGVITSSAVSPNLRAGFDYAPFCVGLDVANEIAIYEGYTYAEGQPIANWPARLVIHDLGDDTWSELTRLGPYGSPCHDDFDVTATYYVGLANRVDQSGLYRYYFDGSPDQAVP